MEKIVLRTYNRLWKMPFKIYSIDNLKLIVPVNPWDVVVFATCVALMAMISKIIFFIKIPFIFKYGIFPWIATKIVDTVKLDGKKPYKYFFDMFMFTVLPKQYEHFKVFKQDKLIGFREKILLKKNKKSNLINPDKFHEETMKKLTINILKNEV